MLLTDYIVNTDRIVTHGGADVFLDGFIAQCRVADGY